MPRSHPFSGRERLQKVVSLGSPKCDRVQARRAVPPQHEGQEPRAEAAARVVEDGPAAFAGRTGRAPFLSVVCHVAGRMTVHGWPARRTPAAADLSHHPRVHDQVPERRDRSQIAGPEESVWLHENGQLPQ